LINFLPTNRDYQESAIPSAIFPSFRHDPAPPAREEETQEPSLFADEKIEDFDDDDDDEFDAEGGGGGGGSGKKARAAASKKASGKTAAGNKRYC